MEKWAGRCSAPAWQAMAYASYHHRLNRHVHQSAFSSVLTLLDHHHHPQSLSWRPKFSATTSGSSSMIRTFSTSSSSSSSSDRLLGYSPMAPSTATTGSSTTPSSSTSSPFSPIPTAYDVSMAGGVWAMTSAKRDKLAELEAALASSRGSGSSGGDAPTPTTLLEAATPAQQLDLFLAQGLQAVALATDHTSYLIPQDNNNNNNYSNSITTLEASDPDEAQSSSSSSYAHYYDQIMQNLLDECQQRALSMVTTTTTLTSPPTPDSTLAPSSPNLLPLVAWEDWLRSVSKRIQHVLENPPPPPPPTFLSSSSPPAGAATPAPSLPLRWPYLRQVRNFLNVHTLPPPQQEEARIWLQPKDEKAPEDDDDDERLALAFQQSVFHFRLLLVQAAAETLKSAWKPLTTVADHDLDRAAVTGQALERQASALAVDRALAVLQAYGRGHGRDRLSAWWNLLDRDGDGRLEEVEMNRVAEWTLGPVQQALALFMTQALEAAPLRGPLETYSGTGAAPQLPPPSWWTRRTERQLQRRLKRMFNQTLRRHFVEEVEMPHRLRCIYAWANKTHQNNRLEQVLVDQVAIGAPEGGGWWSGRKRYVELPPKIHLDEFIQVQQEHFAHLDRPGAEFLKSYLEDLYVWQGQGRQNRQLLREGTLFMTTVGILDWIITSL